MALYSVAGKGNRTLSIRTRVSKDLDKQDQQAEYKKMKYNKGECQTLYLNPNTNKWVWDEEDRIEMKQI